MPKWNYILVIFFFIFACKDKYVPKLHESATGYLVVEGFINAGNGPTIVNLSRTTRIDSVNYLTETGAQVEVQSEDGASYPLAEQNSGKYIINQIPVDLTQKYRLHIKTTNGREYLSDLEEVKVSPPIDSVSFTVGSDGVNFFVSTHDPANNTKYYQWDFEETWKYNTDYYSAYYLYDTLPRPIDTIIILPRTADMQLPTYCWSSDSSKSLIIASSVKLASDVILNFPVASVAYTPSNKLVSRYSINVRQYALTKEWYEWKQKVKRNTEQLGSIFDAQPSETGGNMHSISDPEEKVIGFVGCTSRMEKRIYVDRTQLFGKLIYSGYEGCSELELSVKYNKDSLKPYYYYPYYITGLETFGPTILRVKFSLAPCVDCREKGGTAIKPDFWQ